MRKVLNHLGNHRFNYIDLVAMGLVTIAIRDEGFLSPWPFVIAICGGMISTAINRSYGHG